jgi:hypothetical protein
MPAGPPPTMQQRVWSWFESAMAIICRNDVIAVTRVEIARGTLSG